MCLVNVANSTKEKSTLGCVVLLMENHYGVFMIKIIKNFNFGLKRLYFAINLKFKS